MQPEPTSLGDIVISLETAERQAPEFDNDFNAELNRLIVHGLLHLLGYNL
ncbi:MAG: rRNA maturation RNase YbeY [Bdellovibrionota bacterium]